MKNFFASCLLFCVAFTSAQAQYFLRGKILDEKGIAIRNAKIILQSTKLVSISDNDGSFGVKSSLKYDSITVAHDGFEKLTILVKTDVWQNVILKISNATLIKNKPKLISFTKDANKSQRFNPIVSDETYFKLVENEFVNSSNFPNTSFSLNVNKASYSNVRRFINMQSKVPPDAVRVEEIVNYFNLGYEKPDGKDIFKIKSAIIDCPWNKKSELLFVKLSAKKIDINKIPAGNFVFLIDVSGSMDMPNRLPLLKEAFQLFVKNLRPIDKVSIVTYGGMVCTWLPPTAGDEKQKICDRLELLEAAGDTPGESAIDAAYKLARATFIPSGNNRVILATDGDFNVGQTSEKALDDLITKQRESGISLTCLGVGMGNFKDSKLQTLAKRGNGNYAYLDDLFEAEKVLVHELTETLYTVADNAFINLQFNPQRVKSYRLIGFDNKREAVQDGSSDLDGGEIGSGSSSMAIFEIVPENAIANLKSSNVGTLQLKFHDINDKTKAVQQTNFELQGEIKDTTNKCIKFAAALAMFGLKLKESSYLNKATWADVKLVSDAAADKNIFLQAEFIKILDKTIEIYEPNKKKKKGEADRIKLFLQLR